MGLFLEDILGCSTCIDLGFSRGEEYDASVEICRIKDNLARHKNDLHAMLLESVDYMGNTNSDLGNNSILESGLDNRSGASGSRKSSSAISNR